MNAVGGTKRILERLFRPLIPKFGRRGLANWMRRVTWVLKYLKGPRDNFLQFRCNICGEDTSFPREEISREYWSCVHCGSNVRWRSLIHALSTELFGTSMAISDFPNRSDLVGIGMSDWDGYAERLSEKLAYTNTYYHQKPFLDITSVDPSQHGRYDFIISSDVFEHISQPILTAFKNARLLLKPGGVMIFTVPYVEGETREHFPELYRSSIQKKGDKWTLLNQTSDGRNQEFSELTFHGGPGTVLEMRVFGKDTLLRNFGDASFGYARPYNEEMLKFGICWLAYVAEEAPYRPLVYGLDTPPWALRNRSSKLTNG